MRRSIYHLLESDDERTCFKYVSILKGHVMLNKGESDAARIFIFRYHLSSSKLHHIWGQAFIYPSLEPDYSYHIVPLFHSSNDEIRYYPYGLLYKHGLCRLD
jgi:hypothetical protein